MFTLAPASHVADEGRTSRFLLRMPSNSICIHSYADATAIRSDMELEKGLKYSGVRFRFPRRMIAEVVKQNPGRTGKQGQNFTQPRTNHHLEFCTYILLYYVLVLTTFVILRFQQLTELPCAHYVGKLSWE